MGDKITAFSCDHVGVAGTTQVFVRESDGTFEARVGFAIMGYTNMDPGKLAAMSPFDEAFHDNYATGIGATKELALEALKADIRRTSESFFEELGDQ